MPSLQAARNGAIVATLAAIAVLVGAFAEMRWLVIAAALVAAIAAALTAISLRRVPSPPAESAPKPEPDVAPASAGEPPVADRPKKRAETTVLLSTLRNMSTGSDRLAGDLQRILAGIVADERGSIDSREDQSLVASFSKSDHAAAAVHAAQRMLSNVDALNRRLGHDLGIAIGVHTGPKGEETLEMGARVREGSTATVPVLVSEAAARHLGNQLEKVDTLQGEGWAVDVFTFPPAQKRLPGL